MAGEESRESRRKELLHRGKLRGDRPPTAAADPGKHCNCATIQLIFYKLSLTVTRCHLVVRTSTFTPIIVAMSN